MIVNYRQDLAANETRVTCAEELTVNEKQMQRLKKDEQFMLEQERQRQVKTQVRGDDKLSDTAIVEYVTKSFQARTKIPTEWKHLIQQVCSANIGSIARACGSLELLYRRTLDHAEELREIDDFRKM